jgi:outer membrane protein insertion porin family
MMKRCIYGLLTLGPVVCAGTLCAQTNHGRTNDVFEVDDISFMGNEAIGSTELLSVIATKETPAGFWTFVYKHISERIGEAPEYFDPAILGDDVRRLKEYYREHGYFRATIDTSVRLNLSKKTVSLTFVISEGGLSSVDSVEYRGLSDLPADILADIFKESRIERGRGYAAQRVAEEGARILNILYNTGYPHARFDSVKVTRRLSNDNLYVSLLFDHGKRYYFGKPEVRIEGAEELNLARIIILRQLDFEEGEAYSVAKKYESERNLNRLGIFDFARIDVKFPSEPYSSDHAPVAVVLKPREKHEVAPEIVINNQNNAFNVGLGTSYSNRNTFGGAQTFTAKVTGLAQSISFVDSIKGIRRGTAELLAQLVQPYFFTNKLSLNWGISLNLDKQVEYFQTVLKNDLGVSLKFPAYTFINYGFFDWTLERVDTRFSSGFDPTLVTDSALSEILQRLKEPQFNSVLSVTLQGDNTNDIFSPTKGSFFSMTLEEAGLFPSLVIRDRAKYPYSQFCKVTVMGKWYAPLSVDTVTIFAAKMKVGVAQQYGSERDLYPIPLNRRFFAGGSGSVRGWRTRELGAVDQPSLGGNALFEGNAELRIHFLPGGGQFLIPWDKVWAVIFWDVGNVWDSWDSFRPNQISMAAGLGLRYNLFFGPIRIDFGIRVYDPQLSGGGVWVFDRRFVSEALAEGVLHFGIGQAF